MSKNNKSVWWKIMLNKCKNYNIPIDEFKKSPKIMYMKDPEFRSWIHDKFNYKSNFKWFNNEHDSWENTLKDEHDVTYRVNEVKAYRNWIKSKLNKYII